MMLAVIQRTVALAAIALLAGVGALALTNEGESGNAGVAPVEAAGAAEESGWYTALAGSRGAAGDAERTTCRSILTPRSLGVTHAVLPCGAKIVLAYGGTEVLTEVIDNRMKRPGRQFELTDSLASRLGIDGTQQIRWRFATRS
jgi:hypothetical protein